MTAEVRVVHDAPPLLTGLLAQEIGELASIPCPTCDGDGLAYPHSTSPRKTTCRECWGEKTVQVPAADIEPRADRCHLCRGRTVIETAAGYDVVCPNCSGSADEPDPDEEQPDPDACIRCDTVTGEALTYGGLCRDCDTDDALADGWIPTHTGGPQAGPQ